MITSHYETPDYKELRPFSTPMRVPGDMARWQETKSRIEKYDNYKMDWDGEEADPILGGTVAFALSLMKRAYEAAKESNVGWSSPDVAPDPDGQLDFLWQINAGESRERTLTLLLSEDNPNDIVLVKKAASAEPERFVASQQQVIDQIVWVLSEKR